MTRRPSRFHLASWGGQDGAGAGRSNSQPHKQRCGHSTLSPHPAGWDLAGRAKRSLLVNIQGPWHAHTHTPIHTPTPLPPAGSETHIHTHTPLPPSGGRAHTHTDPSFTIREVHTHTHTSATIREAHTHIHKQIQGMVGDSPPQPSPELAINACSTQSADAPEKGWKLLPKPGYC